MPADWLIHWPTFGLLTITAHLHYSRMHTPQHPSSHVAQQPVVVGCLPACLHAYVAKALSLTLTIPFHPIARSGIHI